MALEDENRKRKADDEMMNGDSGSNPKKAFASYDFISSVNGNSLVCSDLFTKIVNPPDRFRCALTRVIMSDPVILLSGKVVERKLVEWFRIVPGCTCPGTCTEPGSEEFPSDEARLDEIRQWNDERRTYLRFLLRRLSYSSEDQLTLVAELRALVNDSPSYAEFFAEIGPSAVLELARPLLAVQPASNESLQEDLIVTLTLLAKNNVVIRSFFTHYPAVVEIVIESLRSGTAEARRHAVTLIYYVATVRTCRTVLINSGVIKHLVESVEDGNLLLLLRSLQALCVLVKGSSPRVISGVLKAITDNLADENSIHILKRLMDLLVWDKVVWLHLVASETVFNRLFDVLMETKSNAVMEFCATTLLEICKNFWPALLETQKREAQSRVIFKVKRTGTIKARAAAIAIHNLIREYNQSCLVPTEMEHDKILNVLQVTHSDEVMESCLASLLTMIETENGQAALVATSKQEHNFKVITRAMNVGSPKVQAAAVRMFEWLSMVDIDQP